MAEKREIFVRRKRQEPVLFSGWNARELMILTYIAHHSSYSAQWNHKGSLLWALLSRFEILMIVLCGEMGQLWEMRTISHFYRALWGFFDCSLNFLMKITPKTARRFQAEQSVSNSHDLDAFWFDKKYFLLCKFLTEIRAEKHSARQFLRRFKTHRSQFSCLIISLELFDFKLSSFS